MLLGILAGVVAISAYIPYSYHIIKGNLKPNRFTWAVWTLTSLALYFSYNEVGAGWKKYQPLAYAIGTVFTFILALVKGEGGVATKAEKLSAVGVVISIIIWQLTNSALSAVVINLVIDAFGSVPTTIKVWRDPKSEQRLPWTLFSSGVFLNLLSWVFSLERNFETGIYPVVMTLLVGSIAYLTWFGKPHQRKIKLS